MSTYDIVIYGATGFTGALTAEYLAANAPASTRWALAGRNQQKLEAARDRLGQDVPLLHADAGDRASIDELAAASRVVITTVGPYIEYGEPLVAACAEHGTDYVDLTGEPEFVDRMYVKYNARAEQTGARIVHACGFDSIPHDLGALFTVGQLPEGVPLSVRGYVRAGGRPSGGTFASALTGFSRARQNVQAARERRAAEPRNDGRKVTAVRKPPHHSDDVGAWVVPMPTIDPQIILRSARALDRYGPDFSYAHYLVTKNLPATAGLLGGVAGLFTLAQIPPARKALMNRLPSGSGPSEEQRAKGWFKVRFVGDGAGERVVTEVAGGDPGYGETSKMLAESALCLANDELPATAGQVTTAQAMGDALTARLQRAGITFSVL
ncbi:MAG: saccharopine dehydrogenase family protein [Thermoleophilaceae bacterium]